MNLQKIFLPVAGVAALALAWQQGGWPAVALVGGGIVMWLLLHFTRTMKVLQRASNRPIGYVDSAVMLNVKLKPGVNLLHVMAMTRSMGEQLSPKEEQPEVFRWSDTGGSHVTCEFADGKLVKWILFRPPHAEEAPAAGAGAAPASQAAPQLADRAAGQPVSRPAAPTAGQDGAAR